MATRAAIGSQACCILQRKTARGAAILCHGMESEKNSAKLVFLSRVLAQAGFAALRFDFNYVGESSGKLEDLTCNGELDWPTEHVG